MSDDKPSDSPDTPAASRPSDETQPVRPEPAPAPTGRPRLRERLRTWRRSEGDRTFSLGALIASALAGVIVGGLGVATFQAVTDDHDRDRGGWMLRRDLDGDDRFGGRGGMHGGPRGVPGQVPPSTPPEEEGSAS